MELKNTIVKNNTQINKIISNIIKKQKESNIETISNGKLNKPFDKILKMETLKILYTYCAEFPEFVTSEKISQLDNVQIEVYDKEEIDAHGDADGVHFASGTNNSLKLLRENNNTESREVNNRKIENDYTMKDFISYISSSNYNDLDFFLDALPHELMHTFGFKGGVFEGVTENFTRIISDKYNIRSSFLAHGEETKLIQKIEKSIGKDIIKESAYLGGDKKTEDIDLISETIAETLGIENRKIFTDIREIENTLFYNYKNNISSNDGDRLFNELKNKTNELNNLLDEYIEDNPEKLFKLGENQKELSKDEQDIQSHFFKKVIALQELEINKLQQISKTVERETNFQEK